MNTFEAYNNENEIKDYLLNFNGKITLDQCSLSADDLIKDCEVYN